VSPTTLQVVDYKVELKRLKEEAGEGEGRTRGRRGM
jgi:hypothetical protein